MNSVQLYRFVAICNLSMVAMLADNVARGEFFPCIILPLQLLSFLIILIGKLDRYE